MDIRKINEQFRQFYEYMEEPDAFETESERKMQIELNSAIVASDVFSIIILAIIVVAIIAAILISKTVYVQKIYKIKYFRDSRYL